MAGAGERGDDRPRMGPDPAQTAPSDEPDAPDAAATQLMPTVTRTPDVRRDPEPTVRAVARRPATALPALGRDGGVEQVPSSARATVDRRRRAQAGPDSDDPSADDGLTDPSADDAPVPVVPAPVSAPDVAPAPVSAPDVAPAPDAPRLPAAPDVAPAPDVAGILDDARPPGGAGLPTSEAGRPPRHGLPDDDHGLADLPATAEPPSTLDRPDPVASERHLHASGDPQGASDAQLPALSVAGAAAAVLAASAGTGVEPPPAPPPAEPPPAEPPLAEPRAPGSDVGPVARVETYHGRRRARAPRMRSWLIIALVLLGLAGAVALPYVLRSSSQPLGPLVAGPTSLRVPMAVVASEDGEMLPATSSPPGTATPGATRRPAAVPPATTTPTLTPPPAATTEAPTPFSLTLEAEQVPVSLRPNTQYDANPDCYPNGPDVISRIGNWGQASPGTITFGVTVPAAGEYALTIHYVNTSETRQAEIVVNGGAAVSPWPTFPNTSDPPTCIDVRAPISVTLQQGSNTIRIGNPGSRAPTIDKIVVNRP